MKAKYFVTGILVGAMVTSTISVAADSNMVEAWLTDDIAININGVDKELPEDMHVINYDDRVYTPVRFVAEEMGGTVEFDEESQTVMITKPTPKPAPKPTAIAKPTATPAPTPTPVPTPEPTPTATPVPTSTPVVIQYNEPPVKMIKDDIEIYIYGLSDGVDNTYITLDIRNENTWKCMVDYENAYLEVDGVKYYADLNDNFFWENGIESYSSVSTVQDDGDTINPVMVFAEIPEDAYKMTIHIPILLDTYTSEEGYTEKNVVFDIPVDFEEKAE